MDTPKQWQRNFLSENDIKYAYAKLPDANLPGDKYHKVCLQICLDLDFASKIELTSQVRYILFRRVYAGDGINLTWVFEGLNK